MASLFWLAVGAFCIGTETFVVAPLLPAIAGELGVTLAAAGQLVTIYALTYALASPILGAALGGRNPKQLLIAALALFGLANLVAATTTSLAQLMAMQALLACAAGLFMPTANSTAAALVPAERRGRAVAVVIGGLSVSMVLGVPLGSLIGAVATWRIAFVLIAAVCAIGVVGLWRGVPRNLPRGTASLAERIAAARRPEVVMGLSVTFFWATGIFSFYTFVAPFLTKAVGIEAKLVPLALLGFGAAGWIGNMIGGRMTDRAGARRTIAVALAVLTLACVSFGIAARLGPSPAATAFAAAGFVVGGLSGWTFHPAQTARLLELAGKSGLVALSLNQSALYAGTALGSALGALIVAHGGLAELGWLAVLGQLLALAMLAIGLRFTPRLTPALQPGA
jgi:predicted MFS family arabinose efflux permease